MEESEMWEMRKESESLCKCNIYMLLSFQCEVQTILGVGEQRVMRLSHQTPFYLSSLFLISLQGFSYRPSKN